MSPLTRDIRSWIRLTFNKITAERLRRIRNILKRSGWNLSQYHSSMKSDLHKWLTDWYTLSVKRLPQPATLRQNPCKNTLQEIDGVTPTDWKILKVKTLELAQKLTIIPEQRREAKDFKILRKDLIELYDALEKKKIKTPKIGWETYFKFLENQIDRCVRRIA